ncbi:MAG: 30S ribosomal protein S20, partial [Actinomycetota bacterium]
MANIKQQKKRNKQALKHRERNLRYRSTIRTLFKRVESAEGEERDRRSAELLSLIDRAAARGVIHRNNA